MRVALPTCVLIILSQFGGAVKAEGYFGGGHRAPIQSFCEHSVCKQPIAYNVFVVQQPGNAVFRESSFPNMEKARLRAIKLSQQGFCVLFAPEM